ncbi:16933_t:CDS:2 [Rhizophagus irregularis]|nr:16933_t:CDS:2 [Rhizophagus irregularis]
MSELNKDILYLIFEELQDDIKTLYSSLSVNKTWCELIVPILWRNPWKFLTNRSEILLFNVIISHLSDESKNNLMIQDNDLFKILLQKPLFNYISFCRHLNLNSIDLIIYFIEPKRCFSEIVFLSCNTNRVNGNVLIGLAEICQSIKELELTIEPSNNSYEIIKLIDASKKLINVRLKIIDTVVILCTSIYYPILNNLYDIEESFHIILENSLMRHAHTIQYFKIEAPPATKILSTLINILRNLIVNTNGSLTKISIDYIFHNKTDNENIIKAINQSCPNLMFLKLVFKIENILELEKLLIKCQYLNGFYFHILNLLDLDKLFEVLTRSSPTSLFKFKFNITSHEQITLVSFKLLINNWKGRHPMLLQIYPCESTDYLFDSEIVKRFDYLQINSEDFECFCKHLNLSSIDKIINSTFKFYYSYSESIVSIIKNEIYNLFINESTKLTHLYIPQHFDYQIHLIPGAKHCFSEIMFLSCNTRVNDSVLMGLAGICQSIKELELFVDLRNSSKNSYGIIKLIDASKKLIDVRLLTINAIFSLCTYPILNNLYYIEESFHIILENSLMKHAHTIQYFKINTPPATKILSTLINTLRNLIVNTNGNLTKISIDYIFHSETDNENIIKAIYQSCPNLMFLKLVFRIENILELEKLLIKCQYLNGFYFKILNLLDLDKLFEMLTRSSPTSLFKFKFNIISREQITPEIFKLFINNWKGRHPMLLQITPYEYTDLFDPEIIKSFDHLRINSEDFEW